MFIKLTRIDNKPIWINASFVVTIEPRREGVGAIVVPIGDGLDYDVKENPDEVLRMLDGAPSPKIVPVPTSDCLTKSQTEVKSEPPPTEEKPQLASPVASKPTKRKSRTRTKAVAAEQKSEPTAVSEKSKVMTLSLEDVARLRKLAPKTLAKLKNTLFTQFRMSEVDGAIQSLVERGAIVINATKVVWSVEPTVCAP